jgi:hypothetical protein
MATVKAGRTMDTLSTKLPSGKWIAVELRPGSYATGQTKAAAEAAIRRKIKARNPAPIDEDAMDREIIRKGKKNQKLYPFEAMKRALFK